MSDVAETNETLAEDFNAEEREIAGESKADKFKRLATGRTNNILKGFKSLGQLSSSSYEYTPEQVEKIFAALQEALNDSKEKFEKTKKKEIEFSL